MINLQREVWEDWTVQDFIDALYIEIELIMTGKSWRDAFKTKTEMVAYIIEHQPYYKNSIPEVDEYFINLYGLN